MECDLRVRYSIHSHLYVADIIFFINVVKIHFQLPIKIYDALLQILNYRVV